MVAGAVDGGKCGRLSVVRCSEVICPKFNIFFASPWSFSANKRGIENGIGVSVPCGGRSDGREAEDCGVPGDEDGGLCQQRT